MTEQTLNYIQEQIRTKVLERYIETQDIKKQEIELESTLEALHELTNIPMNEIRSIAGKIVEEYQTTNQNIVENKKRPRVFPEFRNDYPDELSLILEKNKRNFIYHLVPFVVVNAMLIFINIVSHGFPWAIFPFLGWSIGLISHYLKDIHWAKRDFAAHRLFLRTQTHQILSENIPVYFYEPDKIFNGVMRQLMMDCELGELQNFLYTFVSEEKKQFADNAAIQLIRLRDKFLAQQAELNNDDYQHNRNYPRRRNR